MAIETITITCPGTRSNLTRLTGSAWVSQHGITRLINTGKCTVFVVPLDADGNSMGVGGQHHIELSPGRGLAQYYPPAGTEFIAVVCSNNCHGRGQIQRQQPDA